MATHEVTFVIIIIIIIIVVIIISIAVIIVIILLIVIIITIIYVIIRKFALISNTIILVDMSIASRRVIKCGNFWKINT